MMLVVIGFLLLMSAVFAFVYADAFLPNCSKGIHSYKPVYDTEPTPTVLGGFKNTYRGHVCTRCGKRITSE